MTELPPELSALLKAARQAHDPSRRDAARVRANLQAAIGASGTAPGDAAAATATGTAGLFSAQLGAKLLLIGALLGVGAGLWATRKTAERGEAARPAAIHEPRMAANAKSGASSTDSESRARTIEDQPLRAGAGPAARSAPSPRRPDAAKGPATRVRSSAANRGSDRAPVAHARRGARIVPASDALERSSLEAHAAQPAPEHLAKQPHSAQLQAAGADPATALRFATPTRAGELRLLRSALEAINGGHPERGLALLQKHADRYPNGILGLERSGLRVIALCAMGRLEAGRSEQAVFLRTHAQSPLAPRVRASCASED